MNLEDLKLKLKFLEDGDRVYKLDTKINNFYIIKDNGWYGVGIDINLDKTEYFEKFENVRLITKIKYFLNENHKLLELITNKVDLIEEFSLVCFDFINKFDNEKVNEDIIEKANKWWNEWKKLLGNVLKSERDYDFLGELLALNYVLNEDSNAKYSNLASHDIELPQYSIEVKSTTEKYNAEIHVNSQYQLENNTERPLKLIFIRLEKSQIGYSIKDVIESLKTKNYDINSFTRIENIGTSSINEKYRILEARLYNIDDKFPKITLKSLKNDELPKGIVKIEYIVDLDDIDYESINLNF
ncbi:MAG: PD-(D/E)XK motif protein [Clostridia bacterium]|jgi:hypothetical protein|nr:PD-(D/E)XK motif protein [Clostridia bacterium]